MCFCPEPPGSWSNRLPCCQNPVMVSSTSSRQEFAAVIDSSRRMQHLSIRDMARIAGVPAATAQGWLNGRHFPVPALRPNYLRMVERLGLTDQVPEGLWDESWSSFQPRLRTEHAPYLGLRPFGATDRDLYFGRQRESARLAEAVLDKLQSAGHGVVAVMGVSGSGKSSLLAAGLIGRESSAGRLADRSITQVAVVDLAGSPLPTSEVVVVDQLEEVFTLEGDAHTAATAALTELAGRSVVVVGLRADAFADASQESVLASALTHPFLITPLSQDEVREVITGPAEHVGVTVDDDLAPVVLDDLAAGSPVSSAAVDVLPLLSNALLVTWAAGTGDRLTLADYVRSGGVATAVQALAEEVFQSLDLEQQASAQRLMLRLVRVSGDLFVREPLPLDDIDEADRQVLDPFVAARMLTVADNSVRISHDALLTHWQRLHDWIDESRADLVVLEQLRRAVRVWQDSGQSADALIPVERMEVFSEWLSDRQRNRLLSPREIEFIAASHDHFASELAHEHRLSRRLRRGRDLAVILTALALVLTLVTGLLYWRGRGLQIAANVAKLDSQSRQVALEARSIRGNDANLMGQMALVADDVADTREGESVLLDATSVNMPTRWLGAPDAVIARSPDEKLVARANGAGQVTLWRGSEFTSSPGQSFNADESGGPLYGLALTTISGRELLAVGGQQVAALWDVTGEPKLLADLRSHDATAHGIAFDSSHRRVAVAYSDGAIEVWSLRDPISPAREANLRLDPTRGLPTPARAVDFSTTGELFVAGPTDAVARWSLAGDPRRMPDLTFTYRSVTPRKSEVVSVSSQTVAVSPDGREVVAGIQGRTVYRWKLSRTGSASDRPLTGFQNWTNDVSYSRDGATLLVANSDQQVYLFDARTGELQHQYGDAALVTGVEMVGDRPISVGQDGALRVWQARDPVLQAGSTVYGLTTDAKERYLAAATLYHDVRLWDISGKQPRQLPDPELAPGRTLSSALAVAPNGKFMVGGTTRPHGELLSWPLTKSGAGKPTVIRAFPDWYVGIATISPDSSLVAALQYTGDQVALWRSDTSGNLTPAGRFTTPNPQSMAFSPDGRLLAIAIGNQQVQLWDVVNPTKPKLAGTIELESAPAVVTFGNSPQLLAVGSAAGDVTIWDMKDPVAPVRQRKLVGPHAGIYSLAFSPDDQSLVAGGGDNLVWAWHLDNKETEAYLALHGEVGRTNDLRFTGGGHILLVGGSDGRIRTWIFPSRKARGDLCARRGDPLTADEWSQYLPGVEPFDPC